MATRLPLQPTADGFALVATVVVDATPRRLLVDTSSSVGLTLSCTVLPPTDDASGNATACLAKKSQFDACPLNSTSFSLWGTLMCKRATRLPVTVGLGDLSLPNVPLTVLTANSTAVLHGADGILGLAIANPGVGATRAKNFTDKFQSFALEVSETSKTLVLNAKAPSGDGDTMLRQKKMFLNDTAVAILGFRESVDATFVTEKKTQAAITTATSVNGWLDAAWPSIVFPKDVFNAFHKTYLATCTPQNVASSYDIPQYYYCSKSITLPRLAFTTTNGTFFLDRDDYIQADPKDPTRTIVLAQNSTFSKYWSKDWGLGMPFMRKFPSYFDGSGKDYQVTLSCKAGVTCDPTKWVVNGSLPDYDTDNDTPGATPFRPVGGSGGTHSGSSSSGTHTRYWTLAFTIPIVIIVVFCGCRWHYRQHRIDRERRRLQEAAENEDASAAAAPKPLEQQDPALSVAAPTAGASYSLLGGPATLTVTGHILPESTTTPLPPPPPPVPGVNARWHNDLADLETRP